MELQVRLIVEIETSYKDLASSLLQVATDVGRGVDSGTVIAPDGSEVGSWSMEHRAVDASKLNTEEWALNETLEPIEEDEYPTPAMLRGNGFTTNKERR